MDPTPRIGRCRVCHSAGTGYVRCVRCKLATYCNAACQKWDWQHGHHAECRERVCQTVDGIVTLSSQDPSYKDREAALLRRDPNARRLVGGEGGEEEENVVARELSLLRSLIDELSTAGDTEDTWEFATAFFSGVRIVLLDTKLRAHRMFLKAVRDADAMLLNWYSLKGGNAKDLTGARKQWSVTRSDPGYTESRQDQTVAAFIERVFALRRVIIGCNRLLGLPYTQRMEYEKRRNPGARKQYLVDLSGIEEGFFAGLEDWDPALHEGDNDVGLWLLYDWNEQTGQSLYEGDVEDAASPTKKKPKRRTGTEKEEEEEGGGPARPPRPLIVSPSLIQETNDAARDGNVAFRYGDAIQFIVRARMRWLLQLRDALVSLTDDIIGLSAVKGRVASFVNTLIFYPGEIIKTGGFLNFAIFGEPGTGKTEISRRLPRILYALGYLPVSGDFNRTTKPDWVAEYEGQTSHKTRMRTLAGLGQLLVVDEAYNLVTDARDAPGKEALAQLINDIDEFRGLVFFCLLGYEKDIRERLFSTNVGMDGRFPEQWRIPPYSPDELYDIFYAIARIHHYVLPPPLAVEMLTVRDQFTSIYRAGGFTNINARSAARILEHYRAIFAQDAATRRESRQQQQARAYIIVPSLLERAMVKYASQQGLVMYEARDIPQREATTLSHSFAPPSSSSLSYGKGKEEEEDSTSPERPRGRA